MNAILSSQDVKSLLDLQSYIPREFQNIDIKYFGKTVPWKLLIKSDESILPLILLQLSQLRPRKLKELGLQAVISTDKETLLGMKLNSLSLNDTSPEAIDTINQLIRLAGKDFFNYCLCADDEQDRDLRFSGFIDYCQQFNRTFYESGGSIAETKILVSLFCGHPKSTYQNAREGAKTGILFSAPPSSAESHNNCDIRDLFENYDDSNAPPCDFSESDLFGDEDLFVDHDFFSEDKSDTPQEINAEDHKPEQRIQTVLQAIDAEQKASVSIDTIFKSTDPIVRDFIEKLRLIAKLPRPKDTKVKVNEAMFWASILTAPKTRSHVSQLLSSRGDLLVTAPVMNLLREVNKTVDGRLMSVGDEDSKHWFNSRLVGINEMEFDETIKALLGYIFVNSNNTVKLDLTRLNDCIGFSIFHPGLPETRRIFDFSRLGLSKVCAQIRSEIDSEIVGQLAAKEALINAFRATQNGTAAKSRGPVFLYGASGVGKTALVKAFTTALNSVCEDNYEFQVFNMEQSDERDILKIFGCGAQYHAANLGQLTMPAELLPTRVILFDEIEKAHPTVIQSLLSVLSEKECEDRSSNRIVNFEQCIFVFTSNVGQEDALSEKPRNPGSVLANKFSPEFINRVLQGHVCLCKPLTEGQSAEFVHQTARRLREKENITFDVGLANALALMAGELSPRALQGQSSKLLALINEKEDKHILEAELTKHHTHVSFSIADSASDIDKLIAKMGQRKWYADMETTSSLCGNRISIHITLGALKPQYESEHLNYPFMKIITQHESSFSQIVGHKQAAKLLKQKTDLLNEMIEGKAQAQNIEGTLLYGPPGTGKTHVAGAIANRFNGTFIQVNSTDMTVGDHQQNMKKLFEVAHMYAPSIIFLDEIDAIAPSRKNNLSVGGNLMVTSLLTAMDGFEKTKSPVWVIGSTNESNRIDSACLRNGRFGEKIGIDFPLQDEIFEFIKSYLKQHHIAKINHDKLAQLSSLFQGCSVALIGDIVKDACATGESFDQFYKFCIKRNVEKNCGKVKHSVELSEDSINMTAYHEAGHAVAIGLLDNQGFDGIIFSEINLRNDSQGLVQRTKEPGKHCITKRQIKNELQIALAGRAAELLLTKDEDDLSIGACSDISKATEFAKASISQYGFSNHQSLFDHRLFSLSEREVCEEVKEWMLEAHQSVSQLLEQNWHLVTAIANGLINQKRLFSEDIAHLISNTQNQSQSEIKNATHIH